MKVQKPRKKKFKTTKRTKSTKAELIQRVTEVGELLLEGRTRHEIFRIVTTKYSCSERTVDDYIALARVEIEEINKSRLEHDVSILMRNLWKLYREADKTSDKLAVVKEIMRIKGIGSTNLNLFIEDKRELSEMSDEELASMLEGE